jgi:putative restriction endonuclease
MSNHFSDQQVRLAAFEWLRQQCDQLGDVLPRSLISKGFVLSGVRIPLVGPQGIFKPKVLESIPISITTTTNGPYPDSFLGRGYFSYSYRGTDPKHHENVGLREAMRLQRPLIYFLGVVPGKYLAVWPVYIVNDHPEALSFDVAVDDVFAAEQLLRVGDEPLISDSMIARREYITSNVKVRVHQSTFRERVLKAYSEQCTLCRLKHVELLDAAHIIPDAEAGGEPLVENGLSLCKLHHAAFDRYFLGIRPDYTVVLRDDVMHETDGPMLRHGLQGMNGQKLVLPRQTELWPDPDRLAERYNRFCVSI